MQLSRQIVALGHKPQMTGKQVILIDRPINMLCHSVRGSGHRPPEIGDKAIQIIDGLYSRYVGP